METSSLPRWTFPLRRSMAPANFIGKRASGVWHFFPDAVWHPHGFACHVVSSGGTAMFQAIGERMTRNLLPLGPFTMKIILVLFDRKVNAPVVMQRQVATFQCGCSANDVLCLCFFFWFSFGTRLELRVGRSPADLPSPPRTRPHVDLQRTDFFLIATLHSTPFFPLVISKKKKTFPIPLNDIDVTRTTRKSGRVARKTYRWSLEWTWIEVSQILGQDSRILRCWAKKTLQGYMWSEC